MKRIQPRTSYNTITPGYGTSPILAGAGPVTFPLTLEDGDCVVLMVATWTTAAAGTSVSGPGPNNHWERLGEITAGTQPSLFILRNAVAATGDVTMTRAGVSTTGNWNTICQIYKNVDTYGTVYNTGAASASANPVVFPLTASIPGTMSVITGIAAWQGGGSVFLSGVRDSNYGPAAGWVWAGFLRDQVNSAAGSVDISQSWVPGGTVNNFGIRGYGLVLIPTEVAEVPDFSLSSSVSSLSVTQGGMSGSAIITVQPSGGFADQVTFFAGGLPTGVSVNFNPNPASNTSTLTFSAASGAVTGPAIVTITGTSGSLSSSITIALTVNTYIPPPEGSNDLSTRQWLLSSPMPFSAGQDAILWHGEVYIRGIEFLGYTSEADWCVVKDATGRIVWAANGSEGMQPVRLGRIGWVDGFVLDTLGSGLCMVYIK